MDYKKFIKFLMYFDKRKTLVGLKEDQINKLLENKCFNLHMDDFIKKMEKSYDEDDIEMSIDDMSYFLNNRVNDFLKLCDEDSSEESDYEESDEDF